MKKLAVAASLVMLIALFGCKSSSNDNNNANITPVASMFVEGCPIPGLSTARIISNPLFKVEGPDGLGTVGDYLLMNERAAFVIEGTAHNVNTYNYYAGIPIDAVPLNGCSQAVPEQFQEVGFMLGSLDFSDIDTSYLRAFKGEWVEILNDGSNGEAAIIRVHGTDATFWLTELELLLILKEMGGAGHLSNAQYLDVYVDYILPPNSSVMQIEYNLHNTQSVALPMITGLAIFFGNTTELKYPSETNFSIPSVGISLDEGLPWMVASSGNGAWAIGMPQAMMSTVSISGVDAVLDANSLLIGPMILEPDGEPGDTGQVKYVFSVGDHDFNSAIVPLKDVNPEPITGVTYELNPFDGHVFDILTGEPIANALVELQFFNSSGNWVFLDGFYTDENGVFEGDIPSFNVPDIEYRLVAHSAGRPDPLPAYFTPGDVAHQEIGFMPGGSLIYDVRDSTGQSIPAKLLFWQGTDMVHRIYTATGYGIEDLAPGLYYVSVTRGYEYTTYQCNILILPGSITPLQVALERVVDTTGYMSVDTHIHAGPSADNTISIPERIRSVAAEGLEVAVSTDHENVIPWQPGIDETGLGNWVATVLGEEVSDGIPGHNCIFPIEPRYDINARGYPVEWWKSQIDPNYSMDTAELFAAERARGAQIIQVNHPKSGVFNAAKYDITTGLPTQDPTTIGMRPGAEMWSWDFDSFELMNGNQNPFVGTNPTSASLFEDWMSFLNLGHPKTAMGGSDTHDYGIVGAPRNYFPVSSDSPADFDVDELIQAIKEGRTEISAGAFARVLVNNTAGMGDTITDTDGEMTLWVHIEGIPEIDVTNFKIFVNCDQMANVPASDPYGVVKFDGVFTFVGLTWDAHIEVIGFGVDNLPRGMDQYDSARVPRVVTNAIFVDGDGGGYAAPGPKACSYTLP